MKKLQLFTCLSLILYLFACQKDEAVLSSHENGATSYSTTNDSIDSISVQEAIFWSYMNDSSLITEEEALKTLQELMLSQVQKMRLKPLV